jgi:hypothetical protein
VSKKGNSYTIELKAFFVLKTLDFPPWREIPGYKVN